MKTRLFPTILVATCTLAALQSTPLYAEEQHNWQEWGESVGNALENGTSPNKLYHVTKSGIKKVSQRTIDDNLTLHGKIQLNKVAISKNFTCYGFANLSNTSVAGVTTMYGPIHAKGSRFNEMDVRCSKVMHNKYSSVKLSKCSVKKIFLNGKLEADSTDIEHITTFYHTLTLSDSHVESIDMINSSRNKNKRAVIELNNTIVEGSITFAQKGGTVICKGTSKVKGSIIGGTLIKIN